jgi:hypothetical protein
MAAGEINRGARMVLRLLSEPEARLVEVKPGQWMTEAGRGRRRITQTVEGAVVEVLVGRDWLIREPTGNYWI